jgi:hypothetical protein
MKENYWGEPVVPCRHCGEDASMTGTKLCDRCWELEKHIRANPVLAAIILKGIQK